MFGSNAEAGVVAYHQGGEDDDGDDGEDDDGDNHGKDEKKIGSLHEGEIQKPILGNP